MKGRVKHYSAKNGYGFIESELASDIFFHYKELESRNCVKAGNLVSFELLTTGRGLQAQKVTVI